MRDKRGRDPTKQGLALSPPDILKTMGAPRKHSVDPEIAKAICDNLELGMPLNLAAEAEGIPRSTAYRWADEIPSFAGMVARARATGAQKLSKQALEGGKGSSMAGWMLERRYRDDYAAPPRDAATQPTEVKIVIEGGLPKSPE